ncbi:MAG: alkane 1-monooxygenase, partial [Pseudomonas sp.]|nr:alkane 1-monooxygenase [Pseudomonas sp.]
MFERLPSNWMLAIKSIGYWLWLISVVGIPMSYYSSLHSPYSNAWPWLVVVVVFGVIPLLDMLVGRDPANPDEAVQVPRMQQQGYYRLLSLAAVPALIGMLGWAGWVFVNHAAWNWLGQLGWVLSVGTV